MKNLLLGFLVVGVMALALWAYTENYTTKQKLDEIVRLNKKITESRSRLRALNAEWAYLNRPERLAHLVNLNFDELELLILTSNHFAQLGKIPYRELELGLMNASAKVISGTESQ